MTKVDELQATIVSLVSAHMEEGRANDGRLLPATFDILGALASVALGLMASMQAAYLDSHDERITALDGRLANVEQVIVKSTGAVLKELATPEGE